MICPKCGYENNNVAKFCNNCGASVAHDDAPIPSNGAVGVSGGVSKRPSADLEVMKIPDIKIPGVNVYGSGAEPDVNNDFDFTPIEDIEAEDLRRASQPRSMSGLDEQLVTPSYEAPAPNWKTGDTMEMPRVEGQKAASAKEFKAPDVAEKHKGHKGKIIVSLVVALIVLASIGAGITYSMEMWGGKLLPDVVSMEKKQAIAELEAKGFSVRTTEVKSDDKENTVLLMDPSSGSRQPEGTEIVLHVAIARTIPLVLGMSQEEATAIFLKEGFSSVNYVTEKSNETEGAVLSVEPVAGTKTTASMAVTVKIAQPYMVVDVLGKDEVSAVQMLRDEGYETSVVYAYSDAPEGTVFATDPAAGTKLASGSTVTAQIAKSRASELVAKTKDYLSSTGSISVGGTTYEIDSGSEIKVQYTDYNTTTGTITAAAVTVLDGETVRGSQKTKTITIVWDDRDNIVSIS